MSIFGSLFGKKKEFPPSPLRETLFGDMPIDQWPPTDEPDPIAPWSAFISARKHLAAGRVAEAKDDWNKVLQDPDMESRQHLQAWQFLRQHGQAPPTDVAKVVLGIVVEVAMPEGLDLLAAYRDHSARYLNYSGAGVIWDHPDTSLDSVIDELLEYSKHVVDHIGPSDEPRQPPPPRRQLRISILTPSGIHFGQGQMDALSKDPLGGRVLQQAIVLMTSLMAKSKKG